METLTEVRDSLQVKLDKCESTFKEKSDGTQELGDMKDENIKLNAKISGVKGELFMFKR